jgi:hypothetical protein
MMPKEREVGTVSIVTAVVCSTFVLTGGYHFSVRVRPQSRYLLPTAQVEEEGGHGAREHDADEADGLSGSRSGDELARRS